MTTSTTYHRPGLAPHQRSAGLLCGLLLLLPYLAELEPETLAIQCYMRYNCLVQGGYTTAIYWQSIGT